MTAQLRLVPPTPAPKPHDPAQRGYVVVYRRGQTNHCPGCGRQHWHLGRATAECAFCGTALPLAEVESVVSGRGR